MDPPALPFSGDAAALVRHVLAQTEFASSMHRAAVPELMDPIPPLNARGGRDVPPEGWRTVYSLVVTQDMSNPHGGMHGGAAATLVDTVTSASLALLAAEDGFWGYPMLSGMSVALEVAYFNACPVGTKIRFTATVVHLGRYLANIRADISDWDTGKRFAAGTHVKAWRDVRAKM